MFSKGFGSHRMSLSIDWSFSDLTLYYNAKLIKIYETLTIKREDIKKKLSKEIVAVMEFFYRQRRGCWRVWWQLI